MFRFGQHIITKIMGQKKNFARVYALSFLSLFLSVSLYGQKYGQALVDSFEQQLLRTADDTTKVKIMNSESLVYEDINPSRGEAIANQSLALAEGLNWRRGVAEALNALGVSRKRKSDYGSATSFFNRSYEIYDSLGDKKGMAQTLINNGIVFYYETNLIKALDCDLRALRMADELGEKDLIALCDIY